MAFILAGAIGMGVNYVANEDAYRGKLRDQCMAKRAMVAQNQLAEPKSTQGFVALTRARQLRPYCAALRGAPAYPRRPVCSTSGGGTAARAACLPGAK